MHGAVLRKNFFSAEQLEAIAKDFHSAGLEAAEVAMMDFAQKVTRNANSVMQEDIDQLRAVGFSDTDILNITLVAAMRNFFSRVMDALGVAPDPAYMALEESLRQALTVGRPIEE